MPDRRHEEKKPITRVENRLGLLEDELQRFVEVASEELDAERIILFGSLSHRGTVSEWSDLDLIVVAETESPFYERTRRLLNLVRPKVGVDVFVYTPAEWERIKEERPFVREEILKKGKVVYERAEQGR